jgi:hypothetical protein
MFYLFLEFFYLTLADQDYVAEMIGGPKESYNCIKHNSIIVGSSSLVPYQNLFAIVNGPKYVSSLVVVVAVVYFFVVADSLALLINYIRSWIP